MKHTILQVFRQSNFLVGFVIFVLLLLMVFIYPLLVKYPPLEIIGQGTFFPPGVYVSTYDSINANTKYILKLPVRCLFISIQNTFSFTIFSMF